MKAKWAQRHRRMAHSSAAAHSDPQCRACCMSFVATPWAWSKRRQQSAALSGKKSSGYSSLRQAIDNVHPQAHLPGRAHQALSTLRARAFGRGSRRGRGAAAHSWVGLLGAEQRPCGGPGQAQQRKEVEHRWPAKCVDQRPADQQPDGRAQVKRAEHGCHRTRTLTPAGTQCQRPERARRISTPTLGRKGPMGQPPPNTSR